MNRALFVLLLAASMSALAQDKAKPAPAAKPTTAPAAKPAAAPAAKPAPMPAAAKAAPSGAMVANKESKTYHRADCKSAAKIKDANKMSFASAAEASKADYKACKVCKP